MRKKLLPHPHVMHVRDGRVEVRAQPRCVLVDNRPLHFAATNLVKEFGDEFDARATVRRMRVNGAWPALGYAVNAREVDRLEDDRPTQVVRDGRVQQVFAPGELGDVETARRLFGASATFVHFDRAMTEGEVLRMWDDKARKSRREGIEAHRRIEEHLLARMQHPDRDVAELPDADAPEARVEAFLRTWIEPLRARVVASEWCIFDEVASVVATIDAVVRYPNGALGLIDWKHTANIASRLTGPRRLAPPLAHLPDCDVVRYALQLAIYARILERRYGMRVCSLLLVNTRDDGFFTDLPYLEDEAEYLLEHSASKLRSRGAEEPRCASDGLLAIEPVRCDDGEVRSRHVAQASGCRWQPAPGLVEASRSALQTSFKPSAHEQRLVRKLTERSVDWEVLVPPQGMPRVAPNFANFCTRYF